MTPIAVRRLVETDVDAYRALRQRGLKSGIATLCIGGGEAVAMGVELI